MIILFTGWRTLLNKVSDIFPNGIWSSFQTSTHPTACWATKILLLWSKLDKNDLSMLSCFKPDQPKLLHMPWTIDWQCYWCTYVSMTAFVLKLPKNYFRNFLCDVKQFFVEPYAGICVASQPCKWLSYVMDINNWLWYYYSPNGDLPSYNRMTLCLWAWIT